MYARIRRPNGHLRSSAGFTYTLDCRVANRQLRSSISSLAFNLPDRKLCTAHLAGRVVAVD